VIFFVIASSPFHRAAPSCAHWQERKDLS